MVPRRFGLCLAAVLCLLTLNVLSQETTRNLTIPSQTSTTSGTTNTNTNTNANTTATVAHVNGTQSTNTTAVANNATQTAQTNSTQSGTQSATNTSSVPLKSIPDATGGGSVPVPGSTGGKANGRYGPDDQYIAGVGRLAVPLAYALGLTGLSLVIMSAGTL